jgi:hypothetical protein
VAVGEGGKEVAVATSTVAVGLSVFEVAAGSATRVITDVSVAVAEAGRGEMILGAHASGNSAAIQNRKIKLCKVTPGVLLSAYFNRFILEKEVIVPARCRKNFEYF